LVVLRYLGEFRVGGEGGLFKETEVAGEADEEPGEPVVDLEVVGGEDAQQSKHLIYDLVPLLLQRYASYEHLYSTVSLCLDY